MSQRRPSVPAAVALGVAGAVVGLAGPARACGVAGDTYQVSTLWPLVGERHVPGDATLIAFGGWALGEGGCSPVEIYVFRDGQPVAGSAVYRGFADETLFRPDRPFARGGDYEVTFEVDPSRDDRLGTPGAVQVRSRFTTGRVRT